MVNPSWIWKNGELIPHDDATFHVRTQALHFGPTVFEGIRCYGLDDGRANVFRLAAHIERLYASARAFHFEIPFPPAAIEKACVDTVLANGELDSYIRPLAFAGSIALGFGRPGNATETCVLTFPWDNRHLETSQKRGIRVHIASVTRSEGHRVMSKSKVSANYAAGLLAIHEARALGFDDAVLLDAAGSVAEAPTSNVFAVWGDRLVTPPSELPILPGITRDTVLALAKELGIDAEEGTFAGSELATADEIFITGTTCEVTPVCEVDRRPVGDGVPGRVTRALLKALQDTIRGLGPERGWMHWVKG